MNDNVQLGMMVKFDTISSVEYDVYGDTKTPIKKIYNKKLKVPFYGMVVGMVRKATGKLEYDDEGPNRLIIDKYHNFYEVKTGLKNKSVMVHPEDIEIVNKSNISIPNRSDLIFDENCVYSESNNGGDFFYIEEIEPGLVKLESGSSCVNSHNGIYPTEYLTRLLEYAKLELSPEDIFKDWDSDYANKLISKIKELK